jgi:hypothetical protein
VKDICELRSHVHDTNIINGHAFPHKVNVDLNMFDVLVLNRVDAQVDDVDVIAVDKSVLCQ